MEDLFTPDPADLENSLREQLKQKWMEKFPTAPPELIETKVESDLYIKTLERQKDEMRSDLIAKDQELQKGRNLDPLIDHLNNRELPAPVPLKPEKILPTMDINEIERVFDNRYEAKKLAEIENRNFQEVQNKLRDRYGQNAAPIIAEQANTLGLSKEDVNSLAKKSPEAFFRMLGLNQPQERDLFMAPPRNDVRNDSFAPKTQKRTWNYYQDLKAKNPTMYWEPKTQLQMHRDSETLGAAFEDGDFKI